MPNTQLPERNALIHACSGVALRRAASSRRSSDSSSGRHPRSSNGRHPRSSSSSSSRPLAGLTSQVATMASEVSDHRCEFLHRSSQCFGAVCDCIFALRRTRSASQTSIRSAPRAPPVRCEARLRRPPLRQHRGSTCLATQSLDLQLRLHLRRLPVRPSGESSGHDVAAALIMRPHDLCRCCLIATTGCCRRQRRLRRLFRDGPASRGTGGPSGRARAASWCDGRHEGEHNGALRGTAAAADVRRAADGR